LEKEKFFSIKGKGGRDNVTSASPLKVGRFHKKRVGMAPERGKIRTRSETTFSDDAGSVVFGSLLEL